jgi:hypothetical protein
MIEVRGVVVMVGGIGWEGTTCRKGGLRRGEVERERGRVVVAETENAIRRAEAAVLKGALAVELGDAPHLSPCDFDLFLVSEARIYSSQAEAQEDRRANLRKV